MDDIEITPAYCCLMARYSVWQTRSLVAAASTLTDAARWQDRGAIFGSIAQTFNHLLWDDALWIARFGGDPKPETHIHPSLDAPQDWEAFCAARAERDRQLVDWAETLTNTTGTLRFHPGGGDASVEKPLALCMIHLFNHQTHHRGQIHGMLTQAGAEPEPTDLPMMP
ncbi:MAG: DinB family protein [Pseudomonadota bacterium]